MFVGFSPELELAIYTLAVLVKPDEALDINLGGKILQIKTHIDRLDEEDSHNDHNLIRPGTRQCMNKIYIR